MSWTINDMPDQSGKIAVITGANSGLGFEASRELARRHATVVMAVRNLEKGEAAVQRIKAEIPKADLELRKLDLGSLDSVRAFAARVREEHDRVDILLNNAGLMATPAGQTKDGFETQVGTNHFGHFVLTDELMPLLEAADAGRVVTMTSGARMQGQTLDGAQAFIDHAWKVGVAEREQLLRGAIGLLDQKVTLQALLHGVKRLEVREPTDLAQQAQAEGAVDHRRGG